MKQLQAMMKAGFLLGALVFALASLPGTVDAANDSTSWCEQNFPGNPECLDNLGRSYDAQAGSCSDFGCPTWDQICCMDVE
jgi:hypothetical protein